MELYSQCYCDDGSPLQLYDQCFLGDRPHRLVAGTMLACRERTLKYNGLVWSVFLR